MNHNVAKCISIVILFVLTTLFGWLPIWLHHRGLLTAMGSPRRKLVLDILNCFAGGVFLGTCLLHLLAEGREEFEEYKEQVHLDFDFPLYEMITAVGLFLVAIVEKVGFAVMSFSKPKQVTHYESTFSAQRMDSSQIVHTPREPQSGHRVVSHSVVFVPTVTYEGPLNRSGQNIESAQVVSNFVNGSKQNPSFVEGQLEPSNDQGLKLTASMRMNTVNAERMSQDLIGNLTLPPSFESSKMISYGHGNRDIMAEQEHHHHHHSLMASTACQLKPSDISRLSVMRAFLLLVALSFHTVFDGLAVGLQGSAAEVWGVLVAIAIHKSLVAFCLGLELAIASKPLWKRPLVFMFLFAFISPIGIAIGMGVTSGHINMLAQLLVSSILQAMATGTFLYVTFFEILGQQFAHSHQTGTKTWVELVKVAVTVVGFACMAAVKLLDSD